MLPRCYPIIDTDVCVARGLDPVRVAEACLRGGARLLQLRHKSGGGGAFVALADRLVEIARPFDALLIVNDRADVAMIAGAAGVHVGQDDLPIAVVRALLGDRAVIGSSTHTAAQVDRALQTAASYVAVGPIFGTSTKDTGYDPRGLALVRYAAGRGKPVVAIGGITLEVARQVVDAGADSVAVITDLLVGDDPEVRTRAYIEALGRTS